MSEPVENKSKMNVLVKIVLCFMSFLVAGVGALVFSFTIEYVFIESMMDVHALFFLVVGFLAAKDVYQRF